jgi:hypothetical protein
MTFKIFNLDLHISVIQDVKHIFHHLFGPTVEITNWSISGHNWVFNAPTPDVAIINQASWRGIDPSMIAAFQTHYDSFLRGFDAFIVTHTPVFAAIFEKYDKPVLLVNSCRYEQPFGWTGDLRGWGWLNTVLKRMSVKGQLANVSNNKADRDYLQLGAGVESVHIPSLCLYTNATYAPTKPSFVCHGDRSFFPPHHLLEAKPSMGYSWSELYSYKGIVHIPYEMSTMSLFEQYSAGVPLWLPSRAFYETCIREARMPFGSIYASRGPLALAGPLSDLGFWLDRADYYDPLNFKHVRYYDSAADLLRQLEQFELTPAERAERSAWIIARRNTVYAAWHAMLSAHAGFSRIWLKDDRAKVAAFN